MDTLSNEICYKYFSLPNGASWYEAKKYCEERDTRLLISNNMIKFEEFQNLFDVNKKEKHQKTEHVKAWVFVLSIM